MLSREEEAVKAERLGYAREAAALLEPDTFLLDFRRGHIRAYGPLPSAPPGFSPATWVRLHRLAPFGVPLDLARRYPCTQRYRQSCV